LHRLTDVLAFRSPFLHRIQDLAQRSPRAQRGLEGSGIRKSSFVSLCVLGVRNPGSRPDHDPG
jgi:hypothetical protein